MATVVELEACIAEIQAILPKASRAPVKEELERAMGVFQAELEEARKREAVTAVSETEAALAETKLLLSTATLPRVQRELEKMLQKFGEPAAEKAGAPGAAPMEVDAGAEQKSVPLPRATCQGGQRAPAKEEQKAPAKAAAKEEQKAAAKEEQKAPAKVDVRSSGPWTEITTYAQDLGGYSGPVVTVDVRLKGVEQLPAENVKCAFTTSSFDLQVLGLEGKNYRMLKTNLEKDIVVAESSIKIKKNHVIVNLKKVKGEYGFDSWTDLCAKGQRRPAAGKDADPQASIMGMMQDMYNDGDDNMKKIIGEAMYKARRGEKQEPSMPSMDGLKGSDPLDDL